MNKNEIINENSRVTNTSHEPPQTSTLTLTNLTMVETWYKNIPCKISGLWYSRNLFQGDHEVSIETYGRDKICIIEILIPMLIQYKLQPDPDEGSCYLRGPGFCMECFFGRPQLWWDW